MLNFVSLIALFLIIITVNCQLTLKVVHIADDHTIVNVTNCSDPQLYLQFADAITVGSAIKGLETFILHCFQKMSVKPCANMVDKKKICVNETCMVMLNSW